MGILDAGLATWHTYNTRVIESVGMGWDTGAPLWPYQTPETLLFALNFPAYLIAMPIINALRLSVPWAYAALFPSFLIWWSFVGYALDRRIVQKVRPGWRSVALAGLIAILSALLGSIAVGDAFRWWLKYDRAVFTPQNLIMLRLIAPGIWCLALAFVAGFTAKRLVPR